nr:MAG TPA: hypothetical protein [Caudoviricetes sp.]
MFCLCIVVDKVIDMMLLILIVIIMMFVETTL